MRAFGIVLAALVTASALAADPASVELLRPYSVAPAPRGGTVLATFSAPTDADARDLRHAALALRVDGDAAVVFDGQTRGLRIHRSGLRARYAAPKRSKSRIAKFNLSVVAGSLRISLRGERLESRRPPFVELTIAGHLYRFDPAFPDGPPPPVVPLPAGPVEFNTCTRSVVAIASDVTGTVIRTGAELDRFLSTVTASADDIAVLRQNDFSKHMVLVAFGDATAQGVLPYSVTIRNVQSSGAALTVSVDKLQPSSGQGSAGTSGPPRAVFYHAIAVPTSGMPVQFTPTAVAALNPWI